MKRKIKTAVKGFKTKDGAGVSLVRVLGNETVAEFDPFLMLDSFDSTNPDDYTAGFPLHPHRGIETISYVYKGKMIHKDSLGNEASVGDGEVQWMNSGSGIMHEESIPAADRMLGIQLWLNLPANAKMSKPSYHGIFNSDIQEFDIEGGKLRLLAGNYLNHQGHKGDFLPLDYYDIHLNANAGITLNTKEDASIILFTLQGEAYVEGEFISEKTAVKLTEGTEVTIETKDTGAQVLFLSSIALNEPISWAGPIVMNNDRQLHQAFEELQKGTFIKEKAEY